jgi:uncharacterized membrane protein
VHLLHPALVHFAVAFLVTGGLLEALGILARRDATERFGGSLLILGVLALLPTVATGFLAVNTAILPPGAAATAADHERAGLLILAVFMLLMLWKGWHRGALPAAHRRSYAAALLAAVALVVYGAFLGGRIVYGFGAISGAP